MIDCSGLEIRRAVTGSGGLNPSLSALKNKVQIYICFNALIKHDDKDKARCKGVVENVRFFLTQ